MGKRMAGTIWAMSTQLPRGLIKLSRTVPHGYHRLLSMPRAWRQRHLPLTR
jgi:hypothetical protein